MSRCTDDPKIKCLVCGEPVDVDTFFDEHTCYDTDYAHDFKVWCSKDHEFQIERCITVTYERKE